MYPSSLDTPVFWGLLQSFLPVLFVYLLFATHLSLSGGSPLSPYWQDLIIYGPVLLLLTLTASWEALPFFVSAYLAVCVARAFFVKKYSYRFFLENILWMIIGLFFVVIANILSYLMVAIVSSAVGYNPYSSVEVV